MEQVSATHFTLHLDKALSTPIEKASWNPEKDLLAMLTKDQQIILHRFNWQRLWAVSPDKKVTSLCWRPDGTALAVGHEDGSITLLDVENGDVLREVHMHQSPIECMDWVEEKQPPQTHADDLFVYEDRTMRFFPPAPKPPPLSGVASASDLSAVVGPAEEQSGSEAKSAIRTASKQINVLCSGDRDGTVCLSAFGIFPIGKLNLCEPNLNLPVTKNKQVIACPSRVHHARVLKVSLSEDLRQMVIVFYGRLSNGSRVDENIDSGLYCMHINTSLLGDRKKELHQVALQASSILELLDTMQSSIAVMHKQWSDAIGIFNEKLQSLPTMLADHGSHASPRDEFLSLLSCGSATPAVHQFLARSLGEGGLKRLAKVIDAAGRELHVLISDHLQPAAEILAFRVGELRGLSRWRARMHSIGLEEDLIDRAMENAGMVLVQVERLMRIVSDAAGQFRLFFVWLTKSLRQLNNEPSSQTEQLPAINSIAVAKFLETQFENDLVGPHLAPNAEGGSTNLFICSSKERQRLEELALLGGFLDCDFLQRTLSQQIQQLDISCKEAFNMPSTVISPHLCYEEIILLSDFQTQYSHDLKIPISLAYYKDKYQNLQTESVPQGHLFNSCRYICVKVLSSMSSNDIIVVVRDLISSAGNSNYCGKREIIALHIEDGLQCIDLALYKEKQLMLLLGGTAVSEMDSSAQGWLMLLETENLTFAALSASSLSSNLDLLHLCFSLGAVVDIGLRDGKTRVLSHLDAAFPLAVSASRGLACVYAGQRRALLYDLEEDEDKEDEEMQ